MHRSGSRYLSFSSRRRHTRFDCDWSSDVCSSDLVLLRRMVGNRVSCPDSAARSVRPFVPRAQPILILKDSFSRQVKVSPLNCSTVATAPRSEEHTSELQSQSNLVCRLLLEKKNQQ